MLLRIADIGVSANHLCSQGEGHYGGDEEAGAAGPTVAELSDDDGYVSPEFDIPSDSDGEVGEDVRPPLKKPRKAAAPASTLEEEEQLALQLLRNRR